MAEWKGEAVCVRAVRSHERRCSRVLTAFVHQPIHIVPRLPARMCLDRFLAGTIYGNRMRVRAAKLRQPPAFYLNDQQTSFGKDDDNIGIAPPHHRLVIDDTIVGKLRQSIENAPFASGLARRQTVWDHACHCQPRPSLTRRYTTAPVLYTAQGYATKFGDKFPLHVWQQFELSRAR